MTQDWRRTREYRIWSATVKRRDKVCQITACGRRKTGHAHHILNAAHHPELRFDPENGVRICARCHWMLHNLIRPSYRHKTSERDLAILRAVSVMCAKLPEKPSFYR